MPRKVTVTLADGRQVTYANVPYSVTPAAMTARVQKDYAQNATSIDGGGPPAPNTGDFYAHRWQNIAPAQAKSLVQRYTAAGVTASDPRMQGLMQVAGITKAPAAPAQRPSVAQTATAAAKAEPGGDYGTAFAAGVRRGLFGIPERLAAAGERWLPSAITGNTSNASYDNILQLVRAKTDAEMARAPVTGQVGNLVGNVAGFGGAGGLVKAGVAKLAAAGDGVAGTVGNVLQKVTTMAKPTVGAGLSAGQKVANAARIVTEGAAGGGAQAAGEGGDVTHGAVGGAVGAGVVGGAGKLLSIAAQPVKAILGVSTAPQILSKFTTVTADAMKAAADKYKSITGAEPTLFELLPPADRNELMRHVVAGKDPVVDQATKAIAARAKTLGPDMAAKVANVVQPQRAAIRDTIAGDLANARGVDVAKLAPEDHAAIDKAMSSPTDMEALRHTEAEAHISPHADTPVVDNLRDLYPQAPHPTNPDGPPLDLDPEVRSMISGAAGTIGRRADKAGVTVGDISGIMQNLRGALGEGSTYTEKQTAQRALEHLQGVVDDAAPDAGAALQNSTNAYAARSRMIEGMREGAGTRLRDDIQPGTNSGQARTIRNAYDTPEGQNGLVLGQSNALTSDLGGGPADALKATLGISRGRTSREMAQNLGSKAADDIGAAALAQDESAQALASAATKASGAGGPDNTSTMVNALVGLHPGGFAMTKAHAAMKLLKMKVIPENQATAITEMLFSQDPALRGKAVQALSNVPGGQDFLQSIAGAAGTATGGAVAAPAVEQPDDQPQVAPPADSAPLPPNDVPAADPAAPEATGPLPPSGGAVDTASSPYLDHLSSVYKNENPDLLDFADRIQHQESGGKQHDANGNPIISRAGAIGTMQIMPGTAGDAAKAAGLPLDMAALHHDPVYNKALGIAQIGSLLKRYKGDPTKAAAAYNAGPGAVDKAIAKGGNWLSHLPDETQDYVEKVS